MNFQDKLFSKLVVLYLALPACGIKREDNSNHHDNPPVLSLDLVGTKAQELYPLGLEVWENLYGEPDARIKEFIEVSTSRAIALNYYSASREAQSQQFEMIFNEIKPKYDDNINLLDIEEWKVTSLDTNLMSWSMTVVWINAHKKDKPTEARLAETEEVYTKTRSCILSAQTEKDGKSCSFDATAIYSDSY